MSGSFLWSMLALTLISHHVDSTRVIELGEKFLDYLERDTVNPWLVMFYAPWCHHCKMLEPIYNQAANDILQENLGVHVGKVDCTKYTSLATHFSVRGFPTVLFIDKERIIEFNGDRTRKDLLEFTRRLAGPNIRPIADCNELISLRKSTPIMVTYFGPDPVWSNFSALSRSLHSSTWFYQSKSKCDKLDFPSIYILKSSSLGQFIDIKYDMEGDSSLSQWVMSNRFPHFVRISHSNLNHLLNSGKLLAIGIIDEIRSTGELASPEHEKFKSILENIAHSFDDQSLFIFGWTPHSDLMSSIVMHSIDPRPNFIVINSSTLEYFLLDGEPQSWRITQLLERIRSRDDILKSYGGNRFHHRLYRMCFDGYSSLAAMYKGNPILTLLIFGLPLSFLSIILYSSCCSDILDAPEENDSETDEEDETHKKTE